MKKNNETSPEVLAERGLLLRDIQAQLDSKFAKQSRSMRIYFNNMRTVIINTNVLRIGNEDALRIYKGIRTTFMTPLRQDKSDNSQIRRDFDFADRIRAHREKPDAKPVPDAYLYPFVKSLLAHMDIHDLTPEKLASTKYKLLGEYGKHYAKFDQAKLSEYEVMMDLVQNEHDVFESKFGLAKKPGRRSQDLLKGRI